jgi:hypothetical protein
MIDVSNFLPRPVRSTQVEFYRVVTVKGTCSMQPNLSLVLTYIFIPASLPVQTKVYYSMYVFALTLDGNSRMTGYMLLFSIPNCQDPT